MEALLLPALALLPAPMGAKPAFILRPWTSSIVVSTKLTTVVTADDKSVSFVPWDTQHDGLRIERTKEKGYDRTHARRGLVRWSASAT